MSVEPEYRFSTPVILDIELESPETTALRYEEAYQGGLLARPESPYFLPMSAYGKNPPPHVNAYDTSRSFSESSYAYVPAPPFTTQPQGSPAVAPSFHHETQMALSIYPNQARSSYEDQTGSYLHVGSIPVPQVTSYNPSRGDQGTRITVYISSLYELEGTSISLMFGSQKCAATLSKLDQVGGVIEYEVSTGAPPFSATGWHSSQVLVSMLVEGADDEIIGKVSVGVFNYEDSASQGSKAASRKRKADESSEVMKSPVKRPSSQQLRSKDEYSPYTFSPSEGAYSPYMPLNSPFSVVSQYVRPQDQYHAQTQSRNVYQYSHGSATSPTTLKPPSPQVSTWAPYPTLTSQTGHSPGLPSSTLSRPPLSSLPSPAAPNPPLIRTTTLQLQQTPTPANPSAGAQPGQHFNPYALYSHKAVLKIVGSLDSMVDGWSQEELASKRRIVMFKRSQSGSTITTTFKPVSADGRPPNSTCISCIWWESKRECFVTSVDTIYLLEQLVAAKFTVEEKNRIRRNLEGFRPLTVSKAKAESEDFFKVIMAFPNPKPRNIEKDVKVFPWKILAHALKKIIGKYSASPSSTLGPTMLTPASSTGYATDGSSVAYAHDLSVAVSPRSRARSSISIAAVPSYPSNAPSRGISPVLKQELHQQHHGLPDGRLSSTPYVSHMNELHSNPWQSPMHQMSAYPQAGAHNSRPAWDLSAYIDAHPISAAGAQQSMGYERNIADTSLGDNVQKSLEERSTQHMPPP